MYEDYQRRFAEDPFNEDTVRVGDALLDEISEAQRSKWKEMIESTDFTHSSRKAWKTKTVTESKLKSPFLMGDFLHGVKALKNNKAAGLDDMLCEQINNFGEATRFFTLGFSVHIWLSIVRVSGKN